MSSNSYQCAACGHEHLAAARGEDCLMCGILHDVDSTSVPEAVLAERFEEAVLGAIRAATRRVEQEHLHGHLLILPEAVQRFMKSLHMAPRDRVYEMDIKWVAGAGPGYVLTEPSVGRYKEIFLAVRICDWRGVS